jgi:hypothetical protein
MADTDLRKPVASEDKWHPYFKALLERRGMAPARDMLREVWAAFPNPDNHFELEFQTTHLDARLWELYIFAVGQYGPMRVLRPYESPDFLFQRDDMGMGVWIEAVTANPSEKYPAEADAKTVEEIYRRMHEVIPIRLGSPLYSKLKKKYWELPHVAGQAFIIAIGDYSENDPIRRNDISLVRYLYGTDDKVISLPGEYVKLEHIKVEEHKVGDKKIPSGFFALPDAENVSAVIFSNEGTIPKFKRMAFDFDKYPFVRMIRSGTCVDFDPTATYPKAFGYLVGDAPEDWAHGVYVYHNPKAKHPIPLDFFRGIGGQIWVKDGEMDNEFRDFSPFASLTINFEAKPAEDRLGVSDEYLRAFARKKTIELEELLKQDLEFHAWRDKFVK